MFHITFWQDVRGAAATEFALLLAVLGATTAAGAMLLGQAISQGMADNGDCIASAGTSCP